MYTIQKNLTKLNHNQPTNFLDPREQNLIKSKLAKNTYHIFSPYKDSEKVIFYKEKEPIIHLYEIKTKIPIRHQDILGTLFSLNISNEMFGDIIIKENKYYIYIQDIMKNYFEANFTKIKNSKIELEELSLDTLKNYEKKYETIELIVSSTRIDTVIATLIHTNRPTIKEKMKKKEILLNHNYLKSISYNLKPNDIFSIRKYGKFQYKEIMNTTKKNHYIIKINKYI